MIDLNQVSLALRNATARSLILLDEFGKGTLAAGLLHWFPDHAHYLRKFVDGAALFAGVLKYLLSRGTDCPKVLTATHFHDLFHEELIMPSPSLAFLHMEVILTAASGESLEIDTDASSEQVAIRPWESVTYLYRLLPHILDKILISH